MMYELLLFVEVLGVTLLPLLADADMEDLLFFVGDVIPRIIESLPSVPSLATVSPNKLNASRRNLHVHTCASTYTYTYISIQQIDRSIGKEVYSYYLAGGNLNRTHRNTACQLSAVTNSLLSLLGIRPRPRYMKE